MTAHTPPPVTVDVTQKKLLRVEEAAALLSISDRKAWDLIHQGTLVAVKIGHRTLVRPSAIDEYIDSLEPDPLAPRKAGQVRRIGA